MQRRRDVYFRAYFIATGVSDGGGVSGMLCDIDIEAVIFTQNIAGSDARKGDGTGFRRSYFFGSRVWRCSKII